MKEKILAYARNRKGVSLILMAFMLAVLIMLGSLAIDIAYMYFVKNQLQVAADAAALAGAAELDVTVAAGTFQESARKAAWKFACKNRAAGSNVFLVTNSSSDCDDPPSGNMLNGLNSPEGDIVVGFWNGSSFSPTLPPNTVANAVKVVARRTGETPGMPQVGLFLGKIFELLQPAGADWSFMAVKATAIAAMPLISNNEFTMCDDACSHEYPSFDTTERILETPSIGTPFSQMAWTALLTSPASSSTVTEFICADRAFNDVCGRDIYTNPDATNFGKFASVFYDPATPKTECIPIKGITCPPGGTGWWVILPIAPSSACGSSLVNTATPKTIVKYAFARIIRVCNTGSGPVAGCTAANGISRPPLPGSRPGCSPGENSVVIDRFSCIPCAEIGKFIGMTPKLVS